LGNVIVAGGTVMVIVDLPTVSVPVPAIPSHTLTVSSSGDLLGQSSKAALKSDMEGQSYPTPVGYSTATYSVSGTLTWDGVLSGSQESTKLEKNVTAVVVDDTTSGSVVWTVGTPAQMPPPASTPDPSLDYPGTWTLLSAGQTKLVTVE